MTRARPPGLMALPLLAALLGCSDRSFPVAASADGGKADAIQLPDGQGEPDFGIRRDGGGETASACVPRPEVCNEQDDDCDGIIDDGFELQTDNRNCGRCGVTCLFANSEPACAAGRCRMGTCGMGFVDLDGLPQNGCECQLSENGAEVCDGKDNDCDGSVDQGFDLQTDVTNCGACAQVCQYEHATPLCTRGVCGMGACAAGFHDLDRQSRNGCEYACAASNAGVEVCDGQDNDCDGDVDESDPRVGTRCFPPEVTGCDAVSGQCLGLCALGTFTCLPGGLTCQGARLPQSDTCDAMDNDCDGAVDEDYDLQNDPRWCGGCGRLCQLPNAVNGCSAGACVVRSCLAGWVDLDVAPDNGCEYACTPDGPEVCDGQDNDCDGRIDVDDTDLLFPPTNFCVQAGECGKGPGGSPRYAQPTFPVCLTSVPGQAPDWTCNYPASAELFGPNQIAGQETRCDGLDNDCDGATDEDLRPALGSTCIDPTGVGECKRRGVVRCAADPAASPVCDVTGAPAPPTQHELCDGLDNDCDGQIDESWDSPAGFPTCAGGTCRGVRDDVAQVGLGASPFYIYRYEASRVDATATEEGRVETRACSRQSAAGPLRPWSSVSYARAQAACAGAGMRLCRTRRMADCSSAGVFEDEWGVACSAGVTCGAERQPYPYGCSYEAGICNGADMGRTPAVATGSLAACLSSADLEPATPEMDRAFDLSGNLAEWTEDCRTVLGDGTGRRAYTLRGGSFSHVAPALRCDFMSTVVAEDFAFPDTGFRCCSSCPPGLADCAGGCVDQGTDPAHCGRCGAACAPGQTCSNGRCQ
jgi:hypothetical protein